jgi:glutamine amidotransferase
MKNVVTLIDYGVGNLLSVSRALEQVGAEVEITDSPQRIRNAAKLVLPGVGAFADGMAGLSEKDLVDPIRSFVSSGRPLLGICLGMQLLFEESEEFGIHHGLGLIPGKVSAIPDKGTDGRLHKIPHIGWNELLPSNRENPWTGTILGSVSEGDAVYFVHSFAAAGIESRYCVADGIYDGLRILAVVSNRNVHGCQFHPEKSGKVGLEILKSFVALS